MSSSERRRDRRLQAPLYCRPAGIDFLERRRAPIDISYGGVRIYSDMSVSVGQLLKLELFAQQGPAVTYTAEVVWLDRLPPGGVARFDVGLRFINLEPAAHELLLSVLGPMEDASGAGPDSGAPR